MGRSDWWSGWPGAAYYSVPDPGHLEIGCFTLNGSNKVRRFAASRCPRRTPGYATASDQTANSLPLGSMKWKRRPPGKLNIGLMTLPPALVTLASVASRFSL